MAYNWPTGWNETRTEKAAQEWICDRLSVPKNAVRVSIDSEGGPIGTCIDIFDYLGAKPTRVVHEVFARLAQFATGDDVLTVGYPYDKTGDYSYRLQYLFVTID